MAIVVENLYYKAPPENPGGVLFVLMSGSITGVFCLINKTNAKKRQKEESLFNLSFLSLPSLLCFFFEAISALSAYFLGERPMSGPFCFHFQQSSAKSYTNSAETSTVVPFTKQRIDFSMSVSVGTDLSSVELGNLAG